MDLIFNGVVTLAVGRWRLDDNCYEVKKIMI